MYSVFEEDYVMRTIKDLVRFLARIFLKKDTVNYELPDDEGYTQTDYLHKRLIELLKQGKINEAEDLLYKELYVGNEKYMELALDFYDRVNDFDDEFLEKNNFSREEIEEGLKEVAGQFGLYI